MRPRGDRSAEPRCDRGSLPPRSGDRRVAGPASALLAHRDAVGEREQDGGDPIVLDGTAVVAADRLGGLVGHRRVDDGAAPQRVVGQQEASGAQAGHQLLVVVGVAGLVGVDEGQVDDRVVGQGAEGLDGRGDGQLDAIVEPGAGPGLAGDARPLLAHVAADQPAARHEAPGDAHRRRAGERAHLHRERRLREAGQDGEEDALVVADLHPGPVAEGSGLLDQPVVDLVGGFGVGLDVGGGGRVEQVGAR